MKNCLIILLGLMLVSSGVSAGSMSSDASRKSDWTPSFSCDQLFSDPVGRNGEAGFKIAEWPNFQKSEVGTGVQDARSVINANSKNVVGVAYSAANKLKYPSTCVFTVVQFVNSDTNEAVPLFFENESEEQNLFVVLVTARTGNANPSLPAGTLDEQVSRWESDGYAIRWRADASSLDNYVGTLRGEHFSAPSVLINSEFGGVRVGFAEIPDSIHKLLTEDPDLRAGLARTMLVFCEDTVCTSDQFPGSHLEVSTDAATKSSALAAQERESSSSINAPYKFDTGFTFVNSKGQESAPFEQFNRLECVLYAIDADLFISAVPGCEGDFFDQLVSAEVRLRSVREGSIQLMHGSTFPDVKNISFSLPLGVGDQGCVVSVTFTDKLDEVHKLTLNPDTVAGPSRFTTSLEVPPVQQNGKVKFTFHANDLRSCGFVREEVVLAARASVVHELSQTSGGVSALHLLLLNDQGKEYLGFDEVLSLRFVETLLSSIGGVYKQLSTRAVDELVHLRRVEIGAIDNLMNYQALTTLEYHDIVRGVESTVLAVSKTHIDEIAGKNPNFRFESLENVLMNQGKVLHETYGTKTLVVNLIGPVVPRSEGGLGSPCDSGDYERIAASLQANIDGRVEVFVYPIVRLMEGDSIDTSLLRPIDQDNHSASLPSGLYQCTGTSQMVSIFPYYFEPWRSKLDFATRFGGSFSKGFVDNLELVLTKEIGQ